MIAFFSITPPPFNGTDHAIRMIAETISGVMACPTYSKILLSTNSLSELSGMSHIRNTSGCVRWRLTHRIRTITDGQATCVEAVSTSNRPSFRSNPSTTTGHLPTMPTGGGMLIIKKLPEAAGFMMWPSVHGKPSLASTSQLVNPMLPSK